MKRRQLKDPRATSNFVLHSNFQSSKRYNSKSFEPNLRQLMSELRGHTYKGNMEEAIEVFAEMLDGRKYLNKHVYLCMAYGYALNGDYESVNDVINEIHSKWWPSRLRDIFQTFLWICRTRK